MIYYYNQYKAKFLKSEYFIELLKGFKLKLKAFHTQNSYSI